MTYSCEQTQNVLIDQLLGQLSEDDRSPMAAHLQGCPLCRRIQDDLADQDQILSKWGRQMQDHIAQKAQEAAAAFLAHEDVKPHKGIGTFVYYAAAAVVIVGVLLGLLWLLHLRPEKPRQEFVAPGPQQRIDIQRPQDEKQTATPEEPQPPQPDKRLEKELQLAAVLFDKGDVRALAALYQAGEQETKQAVLNYLAQIGTEESLRALAELMESRPPASDPNLLSEFNLSAEEEKDGSSNITAEPDDGSRLSVPAGKKFSRHPDWPGLNEPVMNFYAVITKEFLDGQTTKSECWISLPNKLRDEETIEGKIIIDNGIQRLTLDTKTKESQVGDSWTAQDPPIWIHSQLLSEHLALEYGMLFRDPNSRGSKILTLLENESREQVLVYDIKDSQMQASIQLKAQVDARTLLPERIEARFLGDPNEFGGIIAGQVILDYSPIDASVFDVEVPEGYTEPAIKRRGSFSGRVVDLAGQPVAGADVYLYHWEMLGKKILHTVSDPMGGFEILLPVNQDRLNSSIVLWATLPDEPDFIGWMMLRSEQDMETNRLGGEIPGDPGNIWISDQYSVKKTDDGICIAGGWCTGTADMVLVMEPAGKIVGTVTDKEGLPVSEANICVTFDIVNEFGGTVCPSFKLWDSAAVTDDEGRYEVGYLPRLWDKSEFRIKVSAEGLISEYQTIRTKGPLEMEQVDFELHFSGPVVKGIVKDNYGTPLAERYIIAMIGKKSYGSCSTKTDDQGKFILENCPDDPGLQIRAQLSHNSMALHETEKYQSYVYYPDVIVPIACQPDRMEYEIEMIAILPEMVMDVEVVDSAGNLIPDFPVDIRGTAGQISSQWRSERKLQQRTDENGFVRFTQVPDTEGLHLVFWGGSDCWTDFRQSKDEQRRLEEVKKEYSKYKWLEIPIEVLPDQKEYFVRAVILTERQAKQGN